MWIVGSLGLGHTRERWKEEGKARTRERHRGTADDHSEGDALAMDTTDMRYTRDLTKLYGFLDTTSVIEDMLFCETFQARTALLGKLNNAIEVFQTDLGFLLVLLSIIESRGARGCAVGEGRHEPAADKPTVRARVAVNRQLILLLERVQIVKFGKCPTLKAVSVTLTWPMEELDLDDSALEAIATTKPSRKHSFARLSTA